MFAAKPTPGVLGLGATLVAALALGVGLGDYGLWSDLELGAVDRCRAALGESLSGLLRSPWLPDALRTAGYGAFESAFGVRVPHALAGAGLAGLATFAAARRGAGTLLALVAGALVLAFPGMGQAARTVAGNPIGEFMATAAAIVGWVALTTEPGAVHRPRLTLPAFAALLLASGASSGLLLGVSLPLAAVTLATPASTDRRITSGLWTATLVTAGLAAMLVVRQNDGYIPILGASRDLKLLGGTTIRPFTGGLLDLGMQTFPWLPVALVGALVPPRRGDRWPALWLLAGLTMASAWSTAYGSIHLPLAVPAALCVVAGLAALSDPEHPPVLRRLAVVLALCGVVVLGKDAARTPSRVGSPLHRFLGEHAYPADEVGTVGLLKIHERITLVSILAMGILAGPLRRRGPRAAQLLEGGVLVGIAAQALLYSHVLLPRTADTQSLAGPLDRHRAWAAAGELPTGLATLRLRDRGLDYYGPEEALRRDVTNRTEIIGLLSGEEPAVALVPKGELAGLHQSHRTRQWPLFVLDDSHARLRLVSNVLPSGTEDRNELDAIVLDEVPTLAHETLVRFEESVELVGWEVDEPLVRGDEGRLRLAFRVLRNPPNAIKIHARFQRGRTSRVNYEDQDLTGGKYPVRNWRAGDVILHEQTFKVPVLEIVSGPHDFIVALSKGEKAHLKITQPPEKKGEFGVVLRGTKRLFARIGFVDVI